MSVNSTIQILLLATTLIGESIATRTIDNREIQFPSNNPSTVLIGSHLFTLSKYYDRIVVNSTDPNYKSCNIPYHLNQRGVDPTIKAAATKSGKIVVSSMRSYDFDPNSDKMFVNYTIQMVDPYECSVVKLVTPTELVSDIAPFEGPQIVARQDNTFDIFYWSQTRCAPCRFDDQGKRVPLQHSLKPEVSTPIDYHLHQLNHGKNYAYTFNFAKSTLKVIDQNFEKVFSRPINQVQGDFAVSDASDASYIGAALEVPDDSKSYNYTLFEFKNNLQPVFSKLVTVPFGIWLVDAKINIDSKGTSYVTVWESTMSVKGTTINLRRYNVSGQQIGETMKVGIVGFNQQYREQTFLIDDKQYCLVVHEIGLKSDLTKIKCFDFANEV